MRLHRVLQRGDRQPVVAGEDAQIARVFEAVPRNISVAALTRQLDAGDAEGYTWLRADPASMRPDMASARLLSCGDELRLSAQEADDLLRSLKPMFGDEGFPISAPVPSRWYLSLPWDAELPAFAAPERVYGDDLLAHLPDGAAGRRWRRLLNEAQIILHNHPVNAERIRAGRLPVNSLWFWGAGRLADHVQSALALAFTDEPFLAALCQRAGVIRKPRPRELPTGAGFTSVVDPTGPSPNADKSAHADVGPTLFDLRDVMGLEALDSRWLAPALDAVAQGHADALHLDFGDGLRVRWRPAHRWRVWRRQLPV